VDAEEGQFFQRLEIDYSDLSFGTGPHGMWNMEEAIKEVAERYDMQWSLHFGHQRKRVAIMVSKADHCLYDLLIRHKSGELQCDIPLVLSNHTKLKEVCDQFDVPFIHVPIEEPADGDKEKAKKKQESEIEALLQSLSIDVIILARYMQIMSKEFCDRHTSHAINIHHSFLPAFEGARPYHQAHRRGVKIIGATAHYVTADLDAGPIIEQDVTRITHRDSPKAMIRKGRDLERLVLSRAIRLHLNNRVLRHGNKTVIFEE